MHRNTIDLEDADVTHLANLLAVEQFDLACAFVEIVAERNAISPLLDLSRFGPEFEVDGVAGLKHLA